MFYIQVDKLLECLPQLRTFYQYTSKLPKKNFSLYFKLKLNGTAINLVVLLNVLLLPFKYLERCN